MALSVNAFAFPARGVQEVGGNADTSAHAGDVNVGAQGVISAESAAEAYAKQPAIADEKEFESAEAAAEANAKLPVVQDEKGVESAEAAAEAYAQDQGQSTSEEAPDQGEYASQDNIDVGARSGEDENEDGSEELSTLFAFDAPIALSAREPTNTQFTFEVDAHMGLIGDGPLRLSTELRFSIFDWWELRTAFNPLPSSLISRFRLGSVRGVGAFVLEGGVELFDPGLTLLDTGESTAALRFDFEGGLTYTKMLRDDWAIHSGAHYRQRLSRLAGDNLRALGLDASATKSFDEHIAVTFGLAHAELLGTTLPRRSLDFLQIGRPWMTYYALKEDGLSRGTSISAALTYSLIKNFDVDIFLTSRVHPTFNILMGAGIRWRSK